MVIAMFNMFLQKLVVVDVNMWHVLQVSILEKPPQHHRIQAAQKAIPCSLECAEQDMQMHYYLTCVRESQRCSSTS